MPVRPNLTYPTALVLRALTRGAGYGFDLMDATGLPSGTVYPLLRRLEAAGCVAARWEDEAAALADGRPARRYYEITSEGRALLLRARERFPALDAGLRVSPGSLPALP